MVRPRNQSQPRVLPGNFPGQVVLGQVVLFTARALLGVGIGLSTKRWEVLMSPLIRCIFCASYGNKRSSQLVRKSFLVYTPIGNGYWAVKIG